jgi:L-ascorbate metabolism protein UlaG (beta-lactamase superfamily)
VSPLDLTIQVSIYINQTPVYIWRKKMSTPFAVTRITHSCHLIEIGGLTILTDPWFSEKATYHPGEPIAMAVSDLPTLDAILITHYHYDHCDLDALDAYPDKTVPLMVCASVAVHAREHGFTNVTVLAPWQSTTLTDVTITAAPARHQVEEITFVIQGDEHTVYFAGDTMFIPELRELPDRFPTIDLALLPTNGLRIRPLLNKKIVMDAEDAAQLVALLRPAITIPHHYAFTSGPLGDKLITKADRNPDHFVEAAKRLSPTSKIVVTSPGERVDLAKFIVRDNTPY